MSLIKPKRRRGPRLIWVILIPIVVLLALGGYVYLTMSGVDNSNEMKATFVDYLFYWKEPEGGTYYYLRTSIDGRASLVTLPVYSAIENSKEVLDPVLGPKALDLIQGWLGTKSEFSYFSELSQRAVDGFSSSLGIKASNPLQLIDALAKRGFKIFDYWKLGSISKEIKEVDNGSTFTSKGIAVLLRRLGSSSRMAYQVETLTSYPLKVKVGVSGETVNRLYLKRESVESVKRALSN
jgi:hypothetical protein